MSKRNKTQGRQTSRIYLLTLHPCRPSSCELASISASPLGSYRGLAARSSVSPSYKRTSSGESRSHARAGQSRESRTQAARDPRGDAANENGRRACTTADPLCPCAIDSRARRAPISTTWYAHPVMCRMDPRENSWANYRIARGTSKTGGIAQTLIKNTPSHALFGTVPGTHPTACKRP